MLAAGCVATVGLLASASSLTYVYDKFEKLPRVELSGVLDEGAPAGEPENFLIVGVDNATGLDQGDPVRTGRTQSQLLRHDHGAAHRPRVAPGGAAVAAPRPVGGDPRHRVEPAHQLDAGAGRPRAADPDDRRRLRHPHQPLRRGRLRLVQGPGRGDRRRADLQPARLARPGDRPVRDRPGLRHARPHPGARVRALAALRAAHRRRVGDRPHQRPGPHRPPAGLHPAGAQPGHRQGRPQPRHPRPADRRGPRRHHRRRLAHRQRHLPPGQPVPELRAHRPADLLGAGGGRHGRGRPGAAPAGGRGRADPGRVPGWAEAGRRAGGRAERGRLRVGRRLRVELGHRLGFGLRLGGLR